MTVSLGIPSGWFHVLWSAELAIGDVRPLRYFGKDLVAYRSASGQAVVLDAHCPHLGAHLGHGGRVEGDNIACPFHGWQWGPDGRNVVVPYSARGQMACRTVSWHVHEVNGFIMVWFDPDGAAPSWRIPEIPELADEYFPIWPEGCVRHEDVRVAPQWPIENIVDVAHFEFVHHSAAPAVLEVCEASGPVFHTRFRQLIGSRPSRWTPDGPVTGWVDCEAFGLGYLVNRLTGLYDTIQFETCTPVDEHTSDIMSTVAVRRRPGDEEPSELAQAMIRIQSEQLALDLPIWSNLAYVERPPFAPEEAQAYRALRRWATQFYAMTATS